jgi:conjugative relaxase-like TrwC/TraI family protein
VGGWGGQGAERLGLKGEVTRGGFLALASNKVPGTKESFTVWTKDKRTAGYDFCYSVPKSMSVHLELSRDRVVEWKIDEAFHETMIDVEALMETRVRGADEGGHFRIRITTSMATSLTRRLTRWKSLGRPGSL